MTAPAAVGVKVTSTGQVPFAAMVNGKLLPQGLFTTAVNLVEIFAPVTTTGRELGFFKLILSVRLDPTFTVPKFIDAASR